MKRSAISFAGIERNWWPTYHATRYVLNPLVPRHPRDGTTLGMRIGPWTKWDSPLIEADGLTIKDIGPIMPIAHSCQVESGLLGATPEESLLDAKTRRKLAALENHPMPPSGKWWLRSWIEMESTIDMRTTETQTAGINNAKKTRKEALGERDWLDHRSKDPLHLEFCKLCSWPQDPNGVLNFAKKYGPLGSPVLMRDAKRTYENASVSWGESSLTWFVSIRRVAAICLMMEMHEYATSNKSLDDNFQNNAHCLTLCAQDLVYFGQNECLSFTRWCDSEYQTPQRWIDEARRNEVNRNIFQHKPTLRFRKPLPSTVNICTFNSTPLHREELSSKHQHCWAQFTQNFTTRSAEHASTVVAQWMVDLIEKHAVIHAVQP
jgi:hypothetical protein